jgi:3-dehydroquinate synthase
MEKLEVNIPCQPCSYEIVVEEGLIDRCGQWFQPYDAVAIITDTTVDRLFANRLEAALKGFTSVTKIVVPAGEKSKSFTELEKICLKMSEAGLMRNSAVICLGGGMVGDLGGMAASVYMRGVDFFQFPTTLVAMVDSSIGGKTGINLKTGKNLVGAFKQPKAILMDPSLLQSLPLAEVENGLGEMVKHALFADLSLIDEFERNPKSKESVVKSAKIKVDIIQQDVHELGLRKWLNVGHTVGHAIEWLSKLNHGQAVIQGTFWESFISMRLGLLPDITVVEEAFKRLDLDYLPSQRYDLEKVWEVMLRDKKNVSKDKPNLALIKIAGSEVAFHEIEKEDFIRISNEFYDTYC